MTPRPQAIVFDVLETLFPLEPIQRRFEAIGLPPNKLETFFARVLRDGFALAAIGMFRTFPELAAANLNSLMVQEGLEPDEQKAQTVLSAFAGLPPHNDVEEAFRLCQSRGIPIATLSNGSQSSTEKLIEHSGLKQYLQHVLTIEQVKQWKPRAEVYLFAAEAMGVRPNEVALVAAHSWDCQGAKRAGLISGWVKRKEPVFSEAMEPPDVKGETLVEVVEKLLG
ncbi:MAG TPA: haloacid dehalogenase type II [Tepidisphaeraceae bacterium]|jgi:2-haloacid dehalogenase